MYIKNHARYNNIEFIKEALKHNVEKNKMSKNDASKILESLLKTLMFDIAILNADRHNENWGVLIGKNSTRPIPVFDNGNCFNLYKKQRELLELFSSENSIPTQKDLVKAEQYLKEQNKLLTPSLSVLPMDEKNYLTGKPYLDVLQEYKQMFPALFNEQLKKLYSMNFSKVFNSVEEETGVAVPALVKTTIINSYESRYKEIQKHFGQTKEEVLEEDSSLIF